MYIRSPSVAHENGTHVDLPSQERLSDTITRMQELLRRKLPPMFKLTSGFQTLCDLEPFILHMQIIYIYILYALVTRA